MNLNFTPLEIGEVPSSDSTARSASAAVRTFPLGPELSFGNGPPPHFSFNGGAYQIYIKTPGVLEYLATDSIHGYVASSDFGSSIGQPNVFLSASAPSGRNTFGLLEVNSSATVLGVDVINDSGSDAGITLEASYTGSGQFIFVGGVNIITNIQIGASQDTVGFFGSNGQTRPARPVTLANVITLLQNYNLC